MAGLLDIAGVHTFYGHIEALRGVNLSVAKGEIVTLIGANGAGKSTLLMTVCGTPQARSGSIIFDGEDITRRPTFEIMRKGIAQSPEGRRIFPRMTVLENLQMGAVTANPAHFDTDLEKALSLFPILRQRQGQRGGTLSGGEQQMLAIARGLLARPRLLLLDEPSLGLAPQMVDEVFRAIEEIHKDGTTILLVEQNALRALGVADRAYVIETGRILLSGSGDDLLHNPAVRRAYLGG